MDSFKTIKGESTTEFVEKRSKFIGTIRHCETEEDVISFISEMKTKYWDAKHNVSAFSVENGRLKRFSDDGEPHGTAGKPVIDIIDGSGLTNIAIVVTRYFGGVLLGTGGLVRAYSKSARDAINSALVVEMLLCSELYTKCNYTEHSKLINLINNYGGTVIDTKFSDKIEINYYFKSSDVEKYLSMLKESFSARVDAEIIIEKMMPFEENKNL